MTCAILRLPLISAILYPTDRPIRRMMLSSICAGIFYGRGVDGPEAIRKMQQLFTCWEVDRTLVPMASQAVLEGPVLDRRFASLVPDVVRYLRQPANMDQLIGAKGFKLGSKLRTHQSKTKIPVSTYEEVSVRAIRYLFDGDVEGVVRLLKSVRSIGAMRARGGARIDVNNIEVQVLNESRPLFGMIANGYLLRPFPERLEKDLRRSYNGDIALQRGSFESWYAPYRPVPDVDNRELCLVPSYDGPELVCSTREFSKFFGGEI